MLDAPDWPGHRAGQHVDVRLTAEDGYQAQRSYSIASAPEDDAARAHRRAARRRRGVAVPDRRARPRRRARAARPDRRLLRLGEALGGPLLLVAGGSGVVPLRAMLRHHRAIGSDVPVRLLYSARTQADVIYRDELRGSRARRDRHPITLTREQPRRMEGLRAAGVDHELLAEVAWPPAERPLVYVCGPTGFVEAVAEALVDARPDPGSHQDREVRPDMIALDGNAIAGDLIEALGVDLDRDDMRLRLLWHFGVLRRGRRLPARAGPRRALPRLRRGAGGSRDDPRHRVRRPARHR